MNHLTTVLTAAIVFNLFARRFASLIILHHKIVRFIQVPCKDEERRIRKTSMALALPPLIYASIACFLVPYQVWTRVHTAPERYFALYFYDMWTKKEFRSRPPLPFVVLLSVRGFYFAFVTLHLVLMSVFMSVCLILAFKIGLVSQVSQIRRLISITNPDGIMDYL